MGRFRNDEKNPIRNVKVCQSCDRTWEYWSYGAQSGTEFYEDFPRGGVERERCLYCVKEIKDAVQFKVKDYRSQHRLKQLS